MEILIWLGALLSALGLAGIVACIVIALRARRQQLGDDAMRAKVQGLVALNMGALALSAIGLMMVVFGVLVT